MTVKVLFVQGGGKGAHDEWDRKLVDSLTKELGPGYDVSYPRMPDEADPNYERWREALGKEFAQLGKGAILVGHSMGATILISMLAAEPPDPLPRAVLLISTPFVGEGGWPSEDIASMSDLGRKLPSAFPVYLYHGTADTTVPLQHASLYERAISRARITRLEGRDHQLNNDLSEVAADIHRLHDRRRS
jgi:predicted alpha/beta hydrolase family esterase